MKKHRSGPTAPIRKKTVTIRDYGFDRPANSLGRGESIRRRRRQKLNRLLLITGAVLILALGLWLIRPLLSQPSSSETTQSETAAAMTTTPAMPETDAIETTAATQTAATLSPAERQARLDETAAAIVSMLNSKKGRFAIYYQNLATGEIWQFNDEAPFVAASSIKLGINTYLYQKIAEGEISPDEILTYDSRPYPTGDYEGGTGTVQSQPDGTKYSVRDTSGLSVRISDNCATNMVIRRLGGIDAINAAYLSKVSAIVDYRTRVSYTNYAGSAQDGRHRTCARDLGLHAVNFYQLWLNNPVVYQPLMDDLCSTAFDFGIQKGVPDGVRVAHKIGTNGVYSTENDVGIIFADEPYVLCIMTEMASAQAAHQIQADISKLFFDYISNLRPA